MAGVAPAAVWLSGSQAPAIAGADTVEQCMRRSVMASAALVAAAVTLGAAGVATAVVTGGEPGGSTGQHAPKGDGDGGKFRGLSVVGLTADQQLGWFDARDPGRGRCIGQVTGLDGDARIVGIDYRVQNGLLYGVGDQGGVYTLDTADAKATKVSQLTVPLQGQFFGVDFNPAANRLRVISDTGQNLRHNIDDQNGAPAPGVTVADGPLTLPPVPPAPGATATGVTGAAYTNNDLQATTGTTLFDVDTALDQVAVQSPANAGNLAPTGKLGVDVGPDAGFDIYYSPRRGTNTGYAALNSGGTHGFYAVDMLTGQATKIGDFPAEQPVVDVALPLDQD